MNYNLKDIQSAVSTINEACTQVPLPEATLSDIVRSNSIDLSNLDYAVNNLYKHLYGDAAPRNIPEGTDPTCLRDEITSQSHKLLIINETLALICAKLGV